MDPLVQKKAPKTDDFSQFIHGLPSFSGLFKYLDLQAYYQGTGITKSERYAQFESWLESNSAKLTSEFVTELVLGKNSLSFRNKNEALFILGFWLGIKYSASLYAKEGRKIPGIVYEKDERRMEYVFFDKQNFTKIERDLGKFHIGGKFLSEFSSEMGGAQGHFISGFNNGLHEAAHALDRMNGGIKCLSELATFFVQSSHALPIKYNGSGRIFSFGVRNSSDTDGFFQPGGNDEVLFEYMSFAIGPWIKGHYNAKNIEPPILKFEQKTLYYEPYLAYLFRSNMKPENERQVGPGTLADIDRVLKKRGSNLHLESPEKAASDYCKSVGLKDKEIISMMEEVFGKICEKKYATVSEYLREFERIMNEVFGSPYRENLPPGFAHTSPSGFETPTGTRLASAYRTG